MIMLFVLTVSCLIGQPEELTLYKETERFKVFCTQIDYDVADEMLNIEETFFKQLSIEFDHQYNNRVLLYIYPDLASFHNAINLPNAPDWIIGETNNKNERKTVSPRNPGPKHSYDSVIRANKNGLVTLFIYDKYKNQSPIPYWLHQGVSLYKADFYSDKKIKTLTENISLLPTIEQLEDIEKNNAIAFAQVKGFFVSFSIIKFIDQKWGWNSILELLNDYSKFEKIFKVSKQEFNDLWIKFLIANYRD